MRTVGVIGTLATLAIWSAVTCGEESTQSPAADSEPDVDRRRDAVQQATPGLRRAPHPSERVGTLVRYEGQRVRASARD